MGSSEIVAVILAAGYSSRMEVFKPLLDLGGKPVISRVIDTFVNAGICDVRVVVGYNRDLLVSVLDKLKVRAVVNDKYAEGMFSSVRAGLESLEQHVKAFYILPVDVPLVQSRTVRYLAENYMCNRGRILVPCYRGSRGHPPLIDAKFRQSILDYDGEGGLKGALHQSEPDISLVPVPDENILFDIDSLSDYIELKKRWQQNGHGHIPGIVNLRHMTSP
jgi:molybdenum cofactor cytidylyltransferase